MLRTRPDRLSGHAFHGGLGACVPTPRGQCDLTECQRVQAAGIDQYRRFAVSVARRFVAGARPPLPRTIGTAVTARRGSLYCAALVSGKGGLSSWDGTDRGW